jgi:hypothetical protein
LGQRSRATSVGLQDIAKLTECIKIIDLVRHRSRPVLRFVESVSDKVNQEGDD